MNTPIYDFVKKYNNHKAIRLHMPGHKGVDSLLGIEHMDITEFDGADNLWDAEGIIAESESNAGSLFGAHTFYSTEGSSLSIRAMLFMIKKWATIHNKEPFILAGRNVHKTFINAAALLDIEVDWIMQKPEDSYQACSITAGDVEKYLSDNDSGNLSSEEGSQVLSNKKTPVALYVTSPDYLGNMLDIKSLSEVCKKHGLFLLVDNAHGAYLKFLEDDLHPISLGADMCSDSAHKTLPALTGAAYLHVSGNTDLFFKNNAKAALALFASTSPSYLILQSLDLCNAYLANNSDGFRRLADKIGSFKLKLKAHGYNLVGTEPIKATISTRPYGYTGNEIAEILISKNIYTEYHDDDFIVFMFSTSTSDNDIEALTGALLSINKKEPLQTHVIPVIKPTQVLSFKEALLSDYEIVKGADSVGRILAEPSVSCPPCVPVYMCGERIDRVYTDKPLKVVLE